MEMAVADVLRGHFPRSPTLQFNRETGRLLVVEGLCRRMLELESHANSKRLHLSSVSMKIASRCNLNCSYCYVYNSGDDSWKARPPVMSTETFEAALQRIRRHCLTSGQTSIVLVFHGGEPTLVNPATVRQWCAAAIRELEGVCKVQFALQTNGTRLTDAWLDLIEDHAMSLGVSLDGPRDIHDRERRDHFGNGSYDVIARNLARTSARGIRFGILSVIQFGSDPVAVHEEFIGLGCSGVSYLLPHHNHDTIGRIRDEFGPTPCADFLLPIMNDWFARGGSVHVREFWSIARLVMGGRATVDHVGNDPYGFVFVEADGRIEGLDILRICDGQLYETALNVHHNDFSDLLDQAGITTASTAGTVPLPGVCASCPEAQTCAGGYLPHRYSAARGFDNRSVWCADLLTLFSHMRELLGVSHDETRRFRLQLEEVRQSHARVDETA